MPARDFPGGRGLSLHAFNAGGLDLIPGQGTRSYMLQLKPNAVKLKHIYTRVGVCACVCVCVSVCVQNLIQKVRGFSLDEGRGWYSLSPGTLERYAYGSSLCVLSKVRGLELPPRQQGSLWVYAFHPSRSWVLVLIRLISELEFIPFKFTSYSLFPR